jgi:hypothetical protein
VDYQAKRGVWRGTEYDSQLERDWAATFTAWGMDFKYHPGRIFLSNNDIYEPDFQLDGDVIFEVKGEADQRIDKAWRASVETGIPVIVGRSPWIPAASGIEYAGAVWEPEEWVIVNAASKLRWAHVEDLQRPKEAHYSAMFGYARGYEGIRMFKAIGEDGIK